MKKKLSQSHAEDAIKYQSGAEKTALDPITVLFTGVSFRNQAAKDEAIRRVRTFTDEQDQKHHQAAEELHRFRMSLTQHDLADARKQIARLEASIHQIHRDHGQQIIDAITKNPMVDTVTEGLAAGQEDRRGRSTRN